MKRPAREDQPRRLVKVGEMAAILDVSTRTVSRWAEKGLIPCYRGMRATRYDPEDVCEALWAKSTKKRRSKRIEEER